MTRVRSTSETMITRFGASTVDEHAPGEQHHRSRDRAQHEHQPDPAGDMIETAAQVRAT